MAKLAVRVQPGSSKNEVVGCDADGTLRVRLTAPPVEGRANVALVAFLADRLHIPRSSITVLRGHTARRKLLDVAGLTADELTRRLGGSDSA